jgi:hypothetical protein
MRTLDPSPEFSYTAWMDAAWGVIESYKEGDEVYVKPDEQWYPGKSYRIGEGQYMMIWFQNAGTKSGLRFTHKFMVRLGAFAQVQLQAGEVGKCMGDVLTCKFVAYELEGDEGRGDLPSDPQWDEPGSI